MHQTGDLLNVHTVLAPTTHWLIFDLRTTRVLAYMNNIKQGRTAVMYIPPSTTRSGLIWASWCHSYGLSELFRQGEGQHRSFQPESFKSTTKRTINISHACKPKAATDTYLADCYSPPQLKSWHRVITRRLRRNTALILTLVVSCVVLWLGHFDTG